MIQQNSLKVYLFNVGAGDHIMLEFPDGSLGIIDSFYTHANLLLQEPPALTYLKYLVAKEKKKTAPEKVVISFLCISHADIDHVKEIDKLFQFIIKESAYVVLENLWLFGGHADSITIYQQEIVKLKKKIIEATTGDTKREIRARISKYITCLNKINKFKEYWRNHYKRGEYYFTDFAKIQKYGSQRIFNAYSLGPISRITNEINNSGVTSLINQLFEKIQSLINPLDEKIDSNFESKLNKNSVSAILGIHYGNYNLIFGGDATRETLEASLYDIPQRFDEQDIDLFNPDFLKVSHHGAKGSTSQIIWEKLYGAPKGDILVGISAGRRHNHPHDEFFFDLTGCCKLKCVNHNIYRTNLCMECQITHQISSKIDLDDWFQYHGCDIIDEDLLTALDQEAPEGLKGKLQEKNLLAFIFEFPANGNNQDIKVHKGVSDRIGKYENCVFGNDMRTHYCGISSLENTAT
jgi:beta-lactamase superfamily II metal-dependent hydrolase